MTKAAATDTTLIQHVSALKKKAVEKVAALEKKMLRAEKRKAGDQRQQLQTLRARTFPRNSLQERVDNFGYYYARYGVSLIQELYRHSDALEQQFKIISII